VLWYGSSLAAILSGVYAFIYIYVLAAGQRATGAYHPIAFGEISLVMGFISLAGIRYFHEKHRLLILIPIISVFSGMLACFLSGTRMGAFSIPFLVLIFFIQLGTFKRPWLYRNLMIITILIISISYYNMPKSPLEHRVRAGISDAKSFFNGDPAGKYAVHLGIWAEAWKLFKKHPLTGTGCNGYKEWIEEKEAACRLPFEITKFHSPHNMYLSNMTAFGISGLVILLLIFLTPLLILVPAIRHAWPARDIAYSGFMLIAAFMVFALTECIFIRNININIYVITLAVIIALTRQFQSEGIQVPS
jgi:O-antigen ligase